MKLPERKRIRMEGFDYSKDNLYFITSCVKNMICCFGHIVGTGRDLSVQYAENDGNNRDLSVQNAENDGNNRDQSNPIPPYQNIIPSSKKMILNEWGKIAESQWFWLAKQYPYVVLHEFIIMPNHMHGILEINRANIAVRTGRDLSVQQLPDKIKSLSELMGAYKTTTSRKIHLLENANCTGGSRPSHTFAWHRSFHDHIIRDKKSYSSISNYIRKNPQNWDKDEFYYL